MDWQPDFRYPVAMNAPASFPDREPIKLTIPSFLLLQGFGVFDAYWKAELLDGELWGVPAEGNEEPEVHESFPIKLTIADYELLAKSGAFLEYGRTELIDGVVYAMSPQFRPHGFIKDELSYRLRRKIEEVDPSLSVATEQSMAIPRMFQPQPDIMLTSEPQGEGAIPVASVALIIEVADSSTRHDYRQKTTMYGIAGVPEYWIADVVTRVVRQLWQPVEGHYEQRRDVPFGEPVISTTIDGLRIDTRQL